MDANGDLPLDEENAFFLTEQADEASDAYGIVDGTDLSLGILRVANELTAAQMKTEMRVNSTLAQQIVSRKPSGGYTTLVQLDGVPNTGAIFFRTIKTYAETTAFVGRCGEGLKQSIEECDDGNAVSADGCSSTCRIEDRCGNRAIDAGETCDDGNRIRGDGCSSTCRIERRATVVNTLEAVATISVDSNLWSVAGTQEIPRCDRHPERATRFSFVGFRVSTDLDIVASFTISKSYFYSEEQDYFSDYGGVPFTQSYLRTSPWTPSIALIDINDPGNEWEAEPISASPSAAFASLEIQASLPPDSTHSRSIRR